ncbi:hypothetical protein DPMN_187929 [Dreissena polymorpha]|uniref:Uncharacterized protein n=1 Tax=Dreissena polymorpha TaxID=45954 RepID=A0A9D4I9I9_DREPO|nr:hypothetical protein DPMN_187924 [Dreissena polymorpha]KAH3753294.1 hypothetical protein DPMN_187929 [Dreissena polymorpha]
MQNLNKDSCNIYASGKSLYALIARINTLSAQSSTDYSSPRLALVKVTLAVSGKSRYPKRLSSLSTTSK